MGKTDIIDTRSRTVKEKRTYEAIKSERGHKKKKKVATDWAQDILRNPIPRVDDKNSDYESNNWSLLRVPFTL